MILPGRSQFVCYIFSHTLCLFYVLSVPIPTDTALVEDWLPEWNYGVKLIIKHEKTPPICANEISLSPEHPSRVLNTTLQIL